MPFFCLSVSGRLRLRRSRVEDPSDSLRPCLAMGARMVAEKRFRIPSCPCFPAAAPFQSASAPSSSAATHPIVVQSMTNTDTADVEATARQVKALAHARARSSCASRSTPTRPRRPCRTSSNGSRSWACACRSSAIFISTVTSCCASTRRAREALAKYRINPGNVGRGSKRDPQFAEMIEIACRYDKPVRIGVNWGSLDQDLLTRLMDENSQRAAAARRERRDARGAGRLGARERAARRRARARARSHRHLVQGQRRAGPHRGLSQSRARAATTRCTSV